MMYLLEHYSYTDIHQRSKPDNREEECAYEYYKHSRATNIM